MARAGILTEEDRVELLDGQIIEMSPIGAPHLHAVNRLMHLFERLLLQQGNPPPAVVSVQNPVRLGDLSEPQPDVALLEPRLDPERLPGPEDVLLLIEVADATLEKDREVKLPRYAAAGIPEAWIVALPVDRVEVYRRPSENGYKQALFLSRGDVLEGEALPELGRLPVEDVLG